LKEALSYSNGITRGAPFPLIVFFLIVPLITVFIAAGCEFLPGEERSNTHEYREFMMDTNVTLTLVTEDKDKADRVSQKVFAEMKELEKNLDRGVKDGDVWEINQHAGQRPVEVGPETFELIKKALKLGEETEGAFDITIAPLIDLWGFYDPEGREFEDRTQVPTEEEIEEVLPLVDYTKVEIDEDTREVYLPLREMQLELGGIAKGYVVDQGVEVLKDEGINNAFINAGDIRVIGTREDDDPWQVGIREPNDQPGELLGRFALTDAGVDTSGNYERYFEEDGVRYHHLLDPGTGYPAPELSSSTGISSTATRADALSTAIFIMGPQKGMEFLEETPDLEGVLVTENDEILTSTGMKKKYELELAN